MWWRRRIYSQRASQFFFSWKRNTRRGTHRTALHHGRQTSLIGCCLLRKAPVAACVRECPTHCSLLLLLLLFLLLSIRRVKAVAITLDFTWSNCFCLQWSVSSFFFFSSCLLTSSSSVFAPNWKAESLWYYHWRMIRPRPPRHEKKKKKGTKSSAMRWSSSRESTTMAAGNAVRVWLE